MNHFFFVIFTFFIISKATSQFNTSLEYENNSANEWQTCHFAESVLGNSISLNFGYALTPTEKINWKFIPQIGLGYAKKSIKEIKSTQNLNTFKWKRIDISLRNEIYVFNLIQNENNPKVVENIHLLFSPVFSYSDFGNDSNFRSGSSFSLGISIGVGFNIELRESNRFSPYFSYSTRSKTKWDGLFDYNNTVDYNGDYLRSKIIQFEFGVLFDVYNK